MVVAKSVERTRMDGRRIFVVGFHKCGTTSLHHFFRACGLRSIHFRETEKSAPYALAIRDNMAAGRRAIAGFEQYDAFTNMDYFCGHEHIEIGRDFRRLMADEPEALFILNVRDVDKWVKSRMGWSSEFDREKWSDGPVFPVDRMRGPCRFRGQLPGVLRFTGPGGG